MNSLPIRRAQFDTEGFAAWLSRSGAEVRAPTNPYEVIRYLAYWSGSKKPVTHVVYAKDNGLLTFTSGSASHYIQFATGSQMYPQEPRAQEPVNPRPPKNGPSEGEKRRRKLIERDGDACWFCALPMGADCTIEHLVPRSKGGGNRLDNYALAHAACNRRAADLPLVKKIELRAAMRAEKEEA